jgi:hypothetical protein
MLVRQFAVDLVVEILTARTQYYSTSTWYFFRFHFASLYYYCTCDGTVPNSSTAVLGVLPVVQ